MSDQIDDVKKLIESMSKDTEAVHDARFLLDSIVDVLEDQEARLQALEKARALLGPNV